MASETSAWAGPVTGALLNGRYRLTRRVGRGGMADVWSAQDQALQRPVAVKLFRFDAPGSDEQRIDAEIRTIAQLHHPGIVTVYDAGTAADAESAPGVGNPYLVMELVAGQALADRLTGGPMAPDAVAQLASQLAGALAYVHGQGVVHRDIKPANILLAARRDGDLDGVTAKLTDFGIARLVGSARLTAAGLTLGTANYLSPEQATGAPVGPPADVYSLGLVLVECLTGQVAYPGAGVEAAVARLHRPPAIPPQLGRGWVDLLAAMTAARPAERPTAAEVGRALAADSGAFAGPGAQSASAATTALLTSSPPPADGTRVLPAAGPSSPAPFAAPPRAPGRRHRPPWRGRTWLLVAAAATAAAVLVAIVIATTTGGRAGRPTPRPSYPSVSGTLGQHLKELEGAVG